MSFRLAGSSALVLFRKQHASFLVVSATKRRRAVNSSEVLRSALTVEFPEDVVLEFRELTVA